MRSESRVIAAVRQVIVRTPGVLDALIDMCNGEVLVDAHPPSLLAPPHRNGISAEPVKGTLYAEMPQLNQKDDEGPG